MTRVAWSAGVACVSAMVLTLTSPRVGAQEIKSIPAAEGRPALFLPADTDMGALKLPDSIKVGLRLTYHAGDSVLPGVQSKLVPAQGPGGQWIDPKTGQKFDESQVRGSGGVGYHQANVVAASAKLVAVDGRNYAIVDQQNNITASGGVVATSGNAMAIGVYWIHPRLLALISAQGAPPQPAGVQLVRGPYPIGGKQYNSVAITAEFASGFARTVYDTDTGFLLFSASSNAGEAVRVVDPRGNVAPGKGNTMINHMVFVGARQVETPWMHDPMPNWVAKGVRLSYRGSTVAATASGALPPLGVASLVELGKVAEGVVGGRLTVVRDIGRGLPPQQSQENRFYASAIVIPLWISPATLGNIKPNQVIDEDPITRFRTTFVSINQGMATLVQQGPAETNEHFYDATTGVMAGVRSTQQNQVGQTRTEMMLERR